MAKRGNSHNLTTSDAKKRAMLEALTVNFGNVTKSARMVGIDRRTHYDWMEADPEYKQAVAEMPEIALDYAEEKLFDLMDELTPAAIIFYLKTKGKSRGYVERQEMEMSGEVKLPQIKWADDGEED